MKVSIKVKTIIFLLFQACTITIQAQDYTYPKSKEIVKRVNYLERIIKQPLDANSEIMQLGNVSYEFILFSYAYTCYAMTNLAVNDVNYKSQAIDIIKESISKVLDYKIYSSYGIDNAIDKLDSIPDYSVLYLGHLNLMLGCYRRLTDDDKFNYLNDKISKSLLERYNQTEFLNLESYPSSIWIPDNTVAIASLKLYSTNSGNNCDTFCTKWVNYAKSRYIEKETGVLYSTVNSKTGTPIEEPRGSMLGWSIMFIYQFDKDFAIDLYHNYKKKFSRNFPAFRLFRERYKNNKTSMGDIDSGPIFRGYSIPANEFALSNAVLARDFKTANKLKRLINFGTKKVNKNNELKYKVRFIKMNISPMAEALVLHSITITKWTK